MINQNLRTMGTPLSIAYLVLISAAFPGCHEPVKEETKNTTLASSLSLHVGNEKYVALDTKESVVTWQISMARGTNSQTGYVHISKGELMMENDQLMGGTVEVDMNTIEDKTHGRDSKLVNNLKDPDFFDVKKFPFSTIDITSIASLNDGNKKITGNLTIKGITHAVSFPAKLEVKDGVVKANGKLVIDRTIWDVPYKSRFYVFLADQAMSDSIEIRVNILAKK